MIQHLSYGTVCIVLPQGSLSSQMAYLARLHPVRILRNFQLPRWPFRAFLCKFPLLLRMRRNLGFNHSDFYRSLKPKVCLPVHTPKLLDLLT